MSKHKLLLFLIIILGFVLRFYRLSDIPISLNIDETAIGYNAYSILKTGADEYGKFLPLSLQSFGDWKLPVYPLLDTLSILIFGLTEFAVRFPSALAGLVVIPLIYILANQIFGNRRIALLAAFFLAVSPWGIFFSRIAYEANLATTLFIAGLICFIKYCYERKSGWWLIVASLSWGITIFTYHAFVIFMPLFFVGILYLLFKNKIIREKSVIISTIIFCCFVIASAYSITSQGSLGKLSSTSLFDDKNMLNQRVNIYRADGANENILVKKILHNNYVAVACQIGQNYVATFSPSFLFDKGGAKLMNNIGNFGNFYLLDALLLVVGAGAILWKKEKRMELLLLWFILGPIPSSITSDAPSSTRLYLMLPAFILITSYGAWSIINFLYNKGAWYVLGKTALILLFFVNFIYFLDAYYVHMNYHRAQYFHYGYKEAVLLANKYPNYKVIMYDPTNFPYISFLFYNKYDPIKFRKSVTYYPDNFGPFNYVKSFGRFNFVDKIDYEHLEENTLYIDYRGIRTEDFKIFDPSGQPVFKYFFKNK
jgi:4-amino-4-deoxy-L-arabinose transferase-like glycosyltransferase